MRKLYYHHLFFGADPEFFFMRDGAVIGAEKILPEAGLQISSNHEYRPTYAGVIIDGVQGEFNPEPNECRQVFSRSLASCISAAVGAARANGATLDLSAQTVEVSETEMMSLSAKAQQFGCAPSLNAYRTTKPITKDATAYRKRSAGGHIHISGSYTPTKELLQRKHREVVQLLDIIVGNTCVLIDRDSGNVERRTIYGKAGEYRLPKHGLEYRTLSNFWLRAYPLMSFVLALVRFTVAVAADEQFAAEIMALVDMEKVQRAINTNDAVLARETFDLLKPLLQDMHEDWPLAQGRMERFEHFVNKGLDYWFTEEPVSHWLNPTYIDMGWERFIDGRVPQLMPKMSAVTATSRVLSDLTTETT